MSDLLATSHPSVTEPMRSLTSRRKESHRSATELDRYKVVVNSLEAAVVYADSDGIIQEVNSHAERHLDVHQAQLLGRSIYDLHPPKIAYSIRRIFRDFQADASNDLITLRREIKGKWVVLRFAAVRDEEYRLLGVNLILSDETEIHQAEEQKKAMESQLQREQKLSAIGMQASGIAHNLNGPLAVIVGYLDMMGSLHPDLKEIPLILSQAERMKEIIANMMIKSRHEQDTRMRNVDLNSLLAEELKFLESNIDFKNNVAKQYDFARDLPTVYGLYSDFSQIFLNLIHNALDAMVDSQVKKLQISTRRNQEYIYVEISDSGHGLNPKDAVKLFSPFYTTKPPIGQACEGRPCGTGLGLSSAAEISSKYGGQIMVDGRPGEGAKFTVVIPINYPNSELKKIND